MVNPSPYFTDASGDYNLEITDQKGDKKAAIPLGIQSFFYTPSWSPDSKKISFTDKALNLYVLDVESKELIKVDSDRYEHPERSIDPAWSPDSQMVSLH